MMKKRILLLLLIILSTFVTKSQVFVDGGDEVDLTVNQTAVPAKNASGQIIPNTWDVTCSIKTGAAKHLGNSNYAPVVVLIIDNTVTMEGEKLNAAKAAAKEIVNTLFAEHQNVKPKVTVMSYLEGGGTKISLRNSENKTDALSAINNITATTNDYSIPDESFAKSIEVLREESDAYANHHVVFFSDVSSIGTYAAGDLKTIANELKFFPRGISRSIRQNPTKIHTVAIDSENSTTNLSEDKLKLMKDVSFNGYSYTGVPSRVQTLGATIAKKMNIAQVLSSVNIKIGEGFQLKDVTLSNNPDIPEKWTVSHGYFYSSRYAFEGDIQWIPGNIFHNETFTATFRLTLDLIGRHGVPVRNFKSQQGPDLTWYQIINNTELAGNAVSIIDKSLGTRDFPIPTVKPNSDADGDGVVDEIDLDDDNDGILDCVENGLTGDIRDIMAVKGNANFINALEIELTPNTQQQSGAVWSISKADFSKNFTLNMEAFLGDKDLLGADGVAVVFHNDEKGIDALGATGSGIGALGIQNGVVLELDTWDNNYGKGGGETKDIAADHGHIWKSQSGTSLTTPVDLGNIEDNRWHQVVITWDKVTGTLLYMVDGKIAGSYTNPNIVTEIFGGKSLVYFGYTASTGTYYNSQKIRFNNLCNDLHLVKDTDDDGIPDHLDLDSDNDGCPDAIEGGTNDDTDLIQESHLVDQRSTLTAGLGSIISKNVIGTKNLCAVGNLNGVWANGVPKAVNESAGQTLGTSKDRYQSPCFVKAYYDIHQTPQKFNAKGNLLTNDKFTTGVVQEALFYDASGNSKVLNFDEETSVYGKDRNGQWKEAGTIRLSNDGNYFFTSHVDFNGNVPVDYTVKNRAGYKDSGKLNLKVIPSIKGVSNTPPIVQNAYSLQSYYYFAKFRETAKFYFFLKNSNYDIEKKPLTYQVTALGANGADIKLNDTEQNVYVEHPYDNSRYIKVGTAKLEQESTLLNFNPDTTSRFVGDVPFKYTATDADGESEKGELIASLYNIKEEYTDNGKRNYVYPSVNDDAYWGLQGESIENMYEYAVNEYGRDWKFYFSDGKVISRKAISPTYEPADQTVVIDEGTIVFKRNSINFYPNPGFVGTVPIKYEAVDYNSLVPNYSGRIDKATIYLTILPIPKKRIWIGGVSTDWNNENNWKDKLKANNHDSVEFATTDNNPIVAGDPNSGAAKKDLYVASTVHVIQDLINLSDKAFVVPAGKSITVNGNITGSETAKDANKIQIKATKDQPNGTFYAPNSCGTTVFATVDLYAKGYKGTEKTWTDNIPGSPTINQPFSASYHWQHFGVPVESVVANPTFYKSFLREYSEEGNADNTFYKKWTDLNNSSVLKAFKGYEITQKSALTYQIVGKLNFCNQELTMTRQAREVSRASGANIRYGLGQNIFGNSYTAAIDVKKMLFPNNNVVEQTVYLYNTGSFVNWGDETGSQTNEGIQLAGQYTAIPQNTSTFVYDGRIPSMNGFLLKFTKDETKFSTENAIVSLNYEDVGVSNTKPQTAPQTPLSYLELELASKSTVDRLWLVAQSGTTEGFDNGWDGRKFFGTPTAFIYSETPDGNMQVNTTETLANKVISFYANTDTEYALSVKKNALDNYANLTLLDLETKKIIPLRDEETVYRFKANKKNVSTQRFRLVNTAKVTSDMLQSVVGKIHINQLENQITVNNATNYNGLMQILDVSGRVVMTERMIKGENNYNLDLDKGTYVVVCSTEANSANLKIVVRR